MDGGSIFHYINIFITMKSMFIWIEDLLWSIRCSYGLWIHGPYGLSRIIEKIPFRHLVKYLRKYGASVGEGGIIERGIYIHRPFGKKKPFENLVIGNNVYIGHEVIIDLTMPVIFKDAASIGSRVQIWTHSGYFEGETLEKRAYTEDRGEVTIGEGAMVYSNSLIKHGIKIGAFASIAACSMVNKNVEAYSYASGVPIKVILKGQVKEQ
jgi:acetyltransferase-like isoleucine patch superfamily enzyme